METPLEAATTAIKSRMTKSERNGFIARRLPVTIFFRPAGDIGPLIIGESGAVVNGFIVIFEGSVKVLFEARILTLSS
jgi:hypothetical protein